MSFDARVSGRGERKELGIALVLAVMSIAASLGYLFVSKALASTLFWGALFSLLFLALCQGRKVSVLLILTIALSTFPIYQSSIPIGYRSWHYVLAVMAFIFLLFNPGLMKNKFITPVYIIVFIGVVHLIYSDNRPGVIYSFQQVIGIAAAAGFSIVVIKNSPAVDYNFINFVRVCVVSLFFALLIPNHFGYVPGEEERIGLGLMMDPNGISLVALGLLLFLYAGIVFERNSLFRNVYYLLIPFVVFTIFKTGSRQGGINFVIMTFMFLVFMRAKNGVGRLIPFLVALCLILTLVSSTDLFDKYLLRYERIVEGKTGVDRLEHFQLAVLMVIDNPYGLGPGGFMESFRSFALAAGLNTPYMYMRPHNLFAMVLADWGVFALLALLFFLVKLWKLIWVSRGTAFFPLRVSAFFLLLMNASATTSLAFVPLLFCLYSIKSNSEKNINKS